MALFFILAMMDHMSLKKITDYDLEALIDNELDHEDQKIVLDHIKSYPDAQKRYDELKAQKEAIKRWHQHKDKR